MSTKKNPPGGYAETNTCWNCRWSRQPFQHDPTLLCAYGVEVMPPVREDYPFTQGGRMVWDRAWENWRKEHDPDYKILGVVEAYFICPEWEQG